MAEIADVAFRADDRELVRAKMSMQALGPASAIAGRGVDGLTNSLERTANAAGRTESAATAAARGMVAVTSAATAAARAEAARATAALRASQASSTVDVAAVKAARAVVSLKNAAVAAAVAEEQGARAALEMARANDLLAQSSTRAAVASKTVVASNSNVETSMVKMHNVGNLAAQGFDVVTTAAGGMQAGLIGMQQGLQIAQVAMMSTDGFAKTLAASFAAMLSPVVFLSIGLTTLVAVLVQAVNWTKAAASVVDMIAAGLETAAPYAVALAAALALIYGPAIVSGLLSITAYIVGLGIAAGVAGAQIAAAWLLALGPVGWLIAGIAAVSAAVYVFRDQIKQVFEIDVVKSARDGVNWIIGAYVGGVNGIEAAWKKLPAALGDITIATANAVITGVENMINKVAGMIDSFIDKTNNAIAQLPEWAGGTAQIGKIGTFTFGRVNNSFAGAADDVQKTIGQSIAAAQGKDWVGAIGETIGDGAQYATDKLKELSKWLTSTDDKKKKKGGKTDAEKYSDIVAGAERQIATLEAEQAAIGQTAYETARLKYETQLLNEAQQKGITLTAQQKNELGGLASYMANLEVETKRMKDAFEFAKSTTKSFFTDIRSGLAEGKTLWESFGDAAMNVLDKVIDKLLDNLVDAIFTVNKTASGGGAGGGIGGLIGGLFGWLFNAKGNAFGKNGVTAFANGGAFTNSVVSQPTAFTYANGGAFGVMGEAGPEAIMPLSRGSDGSLGVRVTDAGSGNSSQTNKGGDIIFADQNTFNIGEGADKQTVADLKKTLADRDKTFDTRVTRAVQSQRTKRNQDI